MKLPRWVWRLLNFLPPRLAYKVGLGALVGRFVLLLETTGRKSGLKRVTPLQYEMIGGIIYVASVRGETADWVRNLVADPRVDVHIGSRRVRAVARTLTDPEKIADFIQYRLDKSPRMIALILKLEGIGGSPSREQLVRYARSRTLVSIHPGANNSPEK